MQAYPPFKSAVALIAAISMTGCASIMSGPRKNITINSNPPGAHVRVADKAGREVASLTTPCVANLKRSNGFFVGAKYVATVEKPGYQTKQVQIKPTMNPWVLGNVAVGGAVGILIIDPLTGAFFGLTPAELNVQLFPTAGR